MPDFIALVTIALLFPLSLLYVSACDRLKISRPKGNLP
jgi:hypothetical protein